RLQHRAEDLPVGRDDAAVLEERILAGEIAHQAPRFAHEERTRRHVPRRKAELPECVGAPGGDPCEVECGGAVKSSFRFGSNTTACCSCPRCASAIETQYCGTPCRKLVVPSSGSTIHT